MFDAICNSWYHATHWKNYKRAQQQRQAELHYLSSDRHQAVFQDKLCYVLSLAFEQQLQYTKFSNIAKNYYASIGRDIDIIHLNGSIEIAPILGLSDVIVDIVETGTTLRENNLQVFETIVPISARLIANKASYKFKSEPIDRIVENLKCHTEAKND